MPNLETMLVRLTFVFVKRHVFLGVVENLWGSRRIVVQVPENGQLELGGVYNAAHRCECHPIFMVIYTS